MLFVPASPPMDPLHEREVFDVSLRTDGYESARNQPWAPALRHWETVQVWSTRAPRASAKEWQLLHCTPSWAVVPLRKPDKGYVLIGILDSLPRLSEVRRKAKVTHSQSCLETFFLDEPFIRAAFSGKRPLIETCCHQGFITTEIDECPDPEWADQLSSPNWSPSWHSTLVPPSDLT